MFFTKPSQSRKEVSVNQTLSRRWFASLLALSSVTFGASNAYAAQNFFVDQNSYSTVTDTLQELDNIGDSQTVFSQGINIRFTDDTQGNIHHQIRCSAPSISGNAISGIGNNDYRLEMHITGGGVNNGKSPISTCNSTTASAFHSGSGANFNVTPTVELRLIKTSDTGDLSPILFPSNIDFCMDDTDSGSVECWRGENGNDFRVQLFTTTSGNSITLEPSDVFDFGDAPINGSDGGTTFNYPEASHTFDDTNGNNIQDIRLGVEWDEDPNNQPDSTGLGDDGAKPNVDDEDGFSYPSSWVIGQSAVVDVALYEDTGRTNAGSDMEMHVWVDWNRDGTWDNSEHDVNQTVNAGGVQNFVLIAPSTATPGVAFARVRVCSAGGGCDTPDGVAIDGEVEDYRLELVSLSALNDDDTCDRIVQTSSPDGNPPYTYSNMELGGRPLTFTDITTDIQISNINGVLNENNVNAIGFNRNSAGVFAGLIYGIFTDEDSSDGNQHLFVTDKDGSNFVDLGPIKSDMIQQMSRNNGSNTFEFQLGDYLRTQNIDLTTPTKKLGTANAGDVTPDGSRLVVWNKTWSSFVIIGIRTQTFILKPVNAPIGSIEAGADFAFDEDGNLHMVDLIGKRLLTFESFDASSNAAINFTETSLNFINSADPVVDTPDGKLQPGGLVMDDTINLYAITNGGDHDSDDNGSLDMTNRSVVYRINVLTGDVEFMVATDKSSIQGNDAAGCVETRDYGDAKEALAGNQALSIFIDASHSFRDDDNNAVQDLRLGTSWDPEFAMLYSDNAIGDDRQSLNDEDGIIIPAIVTAGTIVPVEVTISTDAIHSNGQQLYIFSDWDQNNDWDDILIYSNANEQTGTFTINLTIPASADTGYSYLRFRLCSQSTVCNDADGNASDGEVEDYRILISDLVGDNTCDTIAQSQSATGDAPFTFNELNIETNPISLQNLNPQIDITGFAQGEFSNVNALGFNRLNGLFYGTFAEKLTTTPERNEVHLYATDKSGQTFYDLGVIAAAEALSITNVNNSNSYDFLEGEFLRGKDFASAPGGLSMPTAGDISIDGQTMVLWRKGWDSFVLVNLANQTFTTLPLTAPGGTTLDAINPGADLAISAQTGNAYLVDLGGLTLYEVDMSDGTMTEIPLVLPAGFAPPAVDTNGKLNPGGVVIDDAVTIYAITNGGNHDSNGTGSLDITGKSVVYSINAVTGDLKFVIETTENSFQGNDAGGCYDAYDYGDAPDTYGIARHHYLDSGSGGTLTGLPSVLIGNLWDSELGSAYSVDALGDDQQAVDDEDIVIPTSLVVNELFDITIPVSVNGVPNGYLNMWVDINGDGNFTGANEHLLRDENVVSGSQTFTDLTLVSPGLNVYSGPTYMRLRMCQTADTCNEPTGTSPTGEVEDHALTLLSRIQLAGTVFEDNGLTTGIAHDGVVNGTEKGIGNFEVRAILNEAGVPGFVPGDIIGSTLTSGDGKYQLFLPVTIAGKEIILEAVQQSAWIDISEADTSGITQVQGNTTAPTDLVDSLMVLILQAGDDVTGLDFGKVGEPTWTANNFTEAEAGQSVEFTHKFTSQTEGDVTFDIVNDSAVPPNSGWSSFMMHDANCDNAIDPLTEGEITNVSPLSVIADETLCIIVKTFIPAGAASGSLYKYDITADMIFADTAGKGHNITRNLVNTDSIIVSIGGSGQLEITKEINDPINGIVTENTAKPGDTIEYIINFKNIGTATVSNVVIYDVTPPFTRLAQPIECTNAMIPSANINCSVFTTGSPNTINYQGSLQWILQGPLLAGESGSVRYTVTID